MPWLFKLEQIVGTILLLKSVGPEQDLSINIINKTPYYHCGRPYNM